MRLKIRVECFDLSQLPPGETLESYLYIADRLIESAIFIPYWAWWACALDFIETLKQTDSEIRNLGKGEVPPHRILPFDP